jgi:hypothetical protein
MAVHSYAVSFMLSVTYKPFMLSVVMLNVIMLSVVMLHVVAHILRVFSNRGSIHKTPYSNLTIILKAGVPFLHKVNLKRRLYFIDKAPRPKY